MQAFRDETLHELVPRGMKLNLVASGAEAVEEL
jgi:hypothetical protein